MSAFRIAAAAAAVVMAVSTPALAVTVQQAESTGAVQWSDLDVGTPEGAAELDQRINAAARRACRGVRATGSNMSQTAFCRSQIRDSVTARMDEPTREAYAQARAQGRRGAR
ncbi:MAG TPA: UrcA family protein [Brevundimonas sp.]|uniref:UrcA family protein n=1 Tax=Brevundimonas sp. TaxID=1871086 RepID=UPI00260C6920|nr:UrcA family protein [Brevundimonas sp.]HRO34370.1 UrcA family protein [Brevundimonas sp.]